MASSSALWVFGVARLISSARSRLVKSGPGWNSKRRCPSSSSVTMWVPVMSAGIRSGVNWTRAKSSFSTLASERTRTVLPRPGTPSRSTCPPARSAMRVSRIRSRWPTMKRPSSSSTASVISPKRSGVISAGSRRLATDIALLCQILEVLPDEVLLVLRDQLPVDLALGGRAVLGEHLAVGHQAGGLAARGIAGVALRGAAAGALAGDVDLLGRRRALAAVGGAAGAAAGPAAGAAVALATAAPGLLAAALRPGARAGLARLAGGALTGLRLAAGLAGLLALAGLRLTLGLRLRGGLGELRLGLLEAVDGLRGVAVELLGGGLVLLLLRGLLEGLLRRRGVALLEGAGRLLERLRELR